MEHKEMISSKRQYEGRTLFETQERAPYKVYDMLSTTGDLQPVKVDVHDELREDEYRMAGRLLVQDYISDDPSHPQVGISVWDRAGNRIMESKSKAAVKLVHVRPEFVETMNRLRDAQIAKERAAASNMPATKERQDLITAAAQAMAEAARAMQPAKK